MWQRSLMPHLLEQGKCWNVQRQNGEAQTSLSQTMFQAVFTELISRTGKLDITKKRRTCRVLEGERNPERAPQVAVLVLVPGSQGFAAKPEDTVDVRQCLSDAYPEW